MSMHARPGFFDRKGLSRAQIDALISASLGSLTTDDVPEGSNLYFTNERVDDRVAALLQEGTGIDLSYNDAGNALTISVDVTELSTTGLPEGSNLYYTDERVDDRVATLIQNGTGISWSYNDGSNTLTPTISLASFSTTDLAEGSNLYFTNERAQDAVGGVLTDTATIDFTYNDAGNTISAAVLTVPVVDAASDTTTFVALFGSATGNLPPLTDASLTYNSNTDILSTGTLNLTGSAIPTNGINNPAANSLGLFANSTERIRIADSRVILGVTTASPITNLPIGEVTPLHIISESVANPKPAIMLSDSSNFATSGARIYGTKNRNDLSTANTIVQSGDSILKIIGYGANGSSYDPAAEIALEVGGVPGASGDMPGRIRFRTTADGSASLTNRWSIESTGALLASTDNSWDIGASGATRPRRVYVGTEVVSPLFTGNVTGAASQIGVVDAASDTTTWVLLAGSQIGNQAPLSDAGITYNSSTNVLATTRVDAALNGTLGATTANTAVVTTLTVNTNANPDAADGAGLGTSSLGWSDLFLASGAVIDFNNTNNTITHNNSDRRLILTGGSAANNSGSLSISTDQTKLQILGVNPNPALQIATIDRLSASILLGFFKNENGTSATIDFVRGKAATLGDTTAVAADDAVVAINGYAAEGTKYTNLSARIRSLIEGTVSTNNTPGVWVFETERDSGSITEGFRIDSKQNAGFRGSSFGSGDGVIFIKNATTVPSTDPTSGGILYTEGGALKYRGSSGTVTTLATA